MWTPKCMGESVRVSYGVTEEALERLRRRGEAVLEFISFTNVRAASEVVPGEEVFLTPLPYEEVKEGTEGIVCRVVSVEIGFVRLLMGHLDEKEAQRARVRLRFVGYGRIVSIKEERVTIRILGGPVVA